MLSSFFSYIYIYVIYTYNIYTQYNICIYNIYAIVKTMCSLGCQHNDFVATDAPGHIMYGYILLVPMNQRALYKLSKEHNTSGHK